ncbi:MAG: S9 family peptidase, partial [Candidatus Aminicenantes bacterium]|nr:S9 family peptidase [Candidatus Aminicenantes bacterium]
KDLVSGKMLKNEIKNTTGSAIWANDNKTIFYTKKDKTLRSFKIFKHILGGDPGKDKLIFHETDPTFSVFAFKTKSERFIMIGSGSTLTSEYRFINADSPDDKFKIIHPRERGIEYDVDHLGENFYIKTNYMAKNFRLVSTPVNKTEKENWQEIIPNRDDIFLSDFDLFKDYLVVNERKYGLNRFRIIKWIDKSEYFMEFGEEAYSAYLGKNYDYDTVILRYKYSSMTTPDSEFDFDMVTRERKLLKQEKILGGFDPANYKTKRYFATARDDMKIPISLVYRKDKFKKGKNPLYVYAYGSYGASMSASFRSYRLSLLDRGFVYAVAHVRGGQEMGRHWYEDGKLLKKKNTFTDFIDCTQFLIDEKYGDPSKVFAMGGSAGGLLMGAIANMRPDLFKGIIAHVPWVDVVTTMLDDTIPLTTSEYDEWGNPNEKKYYDYMLSYSPYDHVERKDYSAMLVTTGLHDSQVQYWEPAKWVAKLRYKKTDNNPLYLNINMDAGHGGASGRFRRYKETALEYAFIFDLLGMDK